MKRSALLASLTAATLAVVASLLAVPVAALDLSPSAVTIEGGLSEDRVDANRYGANLRWDLKPQWFQVARASLAACP